MTGELEGLEEEASHDEGSEEGPRPDTIGPLRSSWKLRKPRRWKEVYLAFEKFSQRSLGINSSDHQPMSSRDF
ncbi:hypothetical protein L202_03798 [Cryptococcus amylolentus CBS 6039]|uniref:Uncharacterized protein n=2 Tax=Cryptococcus amylolentus TaxID=104669 RepID=A0A1E3HU98_9TREE|nr:hypothetical protein L202_03798 [Cryptococcus amylolentus CBS 6039]ODN79909.1 hypothetical protein L202_03798 [Cryptococcus amylolentus CBS 6039]